MPSIPHGTRGPSSTPSRLPRRGCTGGSFPLPRHVLAQRVVHERLPAGTFLAIGFQNIGVQCKRRLDRTGGLIVAQGRAIDALAPGSGQPYSVAMTLVRDLSGSSRGMAVLTA